MGIEKIQNTAQSVGQRLKLDSHHTMERLGVVMGTILLVGLVVIASSGVSAYRAGKDTLAARAMYTEDFTTSKTSLNGEVEGIYTNELGDKALVMMSFEDSAEISYDASDYQGFLMGSDTDGSTGPIESENVDGSVHVFGSSGYVGMLLTSDGPFEQQLLNLTMRANAELSFVEEQDRRDDDEVLVSDKTFKEHDQWQVVFNPGAKKAEKIKALDASRFDPARAFHEIVLEDEEDQARQDLDEKLVEMRTDLARIKAARQEMRTTKVDGLHLRPPEVPKSVAGDKVTGQSAGERGEDEADLKLETDHVVPGGFDLAWRGGNVYDGYLDTLVPAGQKYGEYLNEKRDEGGDEKDEVSRMRWVLSDGTDLTEDYQSSDVAMQPLINVMNTLSQAYQDYAKHKGEYQSDLMLELLTLDVQLRDVQSNSSVHNDKETLATLD